MKLDPITLALVQNRLDHICQQMGCDDAHCAQPDLQPVRTISPASSPTRAARWSRRPTASRSTPAAAALRCGPCSEFGGRIEEDDVFLLNDPYAAGGNHLPDWVIARPVFVDGAARRLHLQPRAPIRHRRRRGRHLQSRGHRDLPRRHPAAGAEARRGGKVRDDLWRLLLLNTRTPHLLDGDLRAMMGSTAHRRREGWPAHGRSSASTAVCLLRRASSTMPTAASGWRWRSCRDGTYYGEWRGSTTTASSRWISRSVALTIADDRLDRRLHRHASADQGLQEQLDRQHLLGGLHGALLVLRSRQCRATRARSAASASLRRKARW